jgi:hypothetical protein
MGLLLHSSCETPFFTKTFVETFTCILSLPKSQGGCMIEPMHAIMLPWQGAF